MIEDSNSEATQYLIHSPGYDAKYGIDGSREIKQHWENMACTAKNSDDPTQVFWMVEFPEPFLITGVTIYNQGPITGYSMYIFVMRKKNFYKSPRCLVYKLDINKVPIRKLSKRSKAQYTQHCD